VNAALRTLVVLAAASLSLMGCAGGSEPGAGDASTEAEPHPAPLSLSSDLCDDPDNLSALREPPAGSDLLASDDLNREQMERMIDAPTEGPIYLFQLRSYRDTADYADGRAADLTGREASALYDPAEFHSAVGARTVYETDVDNQIDGDEIVWETIEIVEYPCPIALFAVLAHPDHQDLAAHDVAGVEHSAAIVADLLLLPPPADPDQSEAVFPPTGDDPAFDLIHVMDFHDIAQYEPGAGEDERTGREAWSAYQAGGTGASIDLGHYPTGIFEVQGVLSGDDRTFDQILVVHMSSMEGFKALLDDNTRQDGRYHRYAALQNNYSMIAHPTLSEIPTAP